LLSFLYFNLQIVLGFGLGLRSLACGRELSLQLTALLVLWKKSESN